MPRIESGQKDPVATIVPDWEFCVPTPLAELVESTVSALESEFASFLAHEERVAVHCDILREHIGILATPAGEAWLNRLLPLPGLRAGAIAQLLASWLEDLALRHASAWPILKALLAAKDPTIQTRAIEDIARAAAEGRVSVDLDVVETVAAKVEEERSALTSPDVLGQVAQIVSGLREYRLEDLLVSGSTSAIRRLAGRVLDCGHGSPAQPLIERVLGVAASARLAPYLAFTCVTHRDLLDAQPLAADASALASFADAEAVCGERVFCDVVAAIGWARLNCGLEAKRYVGISVARGFPLLVEAPEARIFDGCPDTRQTFERTLIVAVGRTAADAGTRADTNDLVTRFRASNVVHAELLAEILDVAPLTRARLTRVLGQTSRLVRDFAALFGDSPDRTIRDESAAVNRTHVELVDRIVSALARTDDDPLPMSVCRLVQPFEDPASPAEIRTLHGLKRYLHQRGLSLAFGLIGTGPQTTRTVDLAVVTPGRAVEVGRHLEFIDLDTEGDADSGHTIPHEVRVVVDAFAAQALRGIRIQPHVRVFCYGHEVHYFARFRNHPAFIRIDYSPPLRGGMIDLQYAGVSINDLSVHPSPSLDAIRALFERLDFIVSVDATRIQARYDKERALVVEDLHRRATLLFHLVPYLMDLDWTIGSLQVGEEGRRLVVEAWSEFFAAWGVLPFDEFLTTDRAGILVEAQVGPEGAREVRWPGRAPYVDRFAGAPPMALAEALGQRLAALGVELARPVTAGDLAGQLLFDERVFKPLRAAMIRGEIEETPDGLARRSHGLFERVHEVDRLVSILESEPAVVAESVRLAHVVSLLERHARFRTTGSINGYEVQRAVVSFGPGAITIYALRDGDGMARLACATDDEFLWRRRSLATDPWEERDAGEIGWVIDRLRRANVLGPIPVIADGDQQAQREELRWLFRIPRAGAGGRAFAGERIVYGSSASPGRAAGPARLGVGGWQRDKLDGAILVAASLEPCDAPCLFQAAGIVATGGGILSHLGLLAVESGKPALIIQARWDHLPNGETALRYSTFDHLETEGERDGYRVRARHHVRETEGWIHDGDLIVLDAHAGTLTVLGHDATALALHESLRQFSDASRRLASCADGEEVLAGRGYHLRAKHQVEKIVAKVTAPSLARFAVEEILGQLVEADLGECTKDGIAVIEWLVSNPEVGETAAAAIRQAMAGLAHRLRDARDQATVLIPSCTTCHDVLTLRLQVVHSYDVLKRISAALGRRGLDADVVGVNDPMNVDRLTLGRMRVLGDDLAQSLSDSSRKGGLQSRRLELDRLGTLLSDNAWRRLSNQSLAQVDGQALSSRTVLTGRDGGLELAPVAGGKAANLAEVARILGPTAAPAWFAVTDRAFERVWSPELSRCVHAVLDDTSLDDGEKAAAIREMWVAVEMPADLADDIKRGYYALGRQPFVAVRSSALDEDTEHATRAGQFDTFLFVRGAESLVKHVKLAWSGLWTERAIAARKKGPEASDDSMPELHVRPRCGLVIQRMVLSRVSGVMQTINAAEAKPRELVINVGLGLGEGVASGSVTADHVVVSKYAGEDLPLRFRYMTADKRERVVFDDRFGQGTVRVGTLAHQRLRPALEYPELRELVDAGMRLEHAYGHPVDIEFAFEGASLYVLQVRPVPGSLAVWRETMERYPLPQLKPGVEVQT